MLCIIVPPVSTGLADLINNNGPKSNLNLTQPALTHFFDHSGATETTFKGPRVTKGGAVCLQMFTLFLYKRCDQLPPSSSRKLLWRTTTTRVKKM